MGKSETGFPASFVALASERSVLDRVRVVHQRLNVAAFWHVGRRADSLLGYPPQSRIICLFVMGALV